MKNHREESHRIVEARNVRPVVSAREDSGEPAVPGLCGAQNRVHGVALRAAVLASSIPTRPELLTSRQLSFIFFSGSALARPFVGFCRRVHSSSAPIRQENPLENFAAPRGRQEKQTAELDMFLLVDFVLFTALGMQTKKKANAANHH